MREQERQISDECYLQGLCEEEPFIIAFLKKHKIKLRNIRGFIISWRLNPIRQKMVLNRQAAKTEAENKAKADRYFSALHQTIRAFQIMGGKIPEFTKVEHIGLSAKQKEQRRQKIQRQLGY